MKINWKLMFLKYIGFILAGQTVGYVLIFFENKYHETYAEIYERMMVNFWEDTIITTFYGTIIFIVWQGYLEIIKPSKFWNENKYVLKCKVFHNKHQKYFFWAWVFLVWAWHRSIDNS